MEKQEKKTETKRGGAQPKDEAKASAKVVEAGNPTKTFYVDVPEIFVVFSLQQHDSEFKVYGRWVVERSEGVPPNHVLGTDAMILMTEDESGFVSLKRPKNGWPIGDYKVEIFTGTGSHDMSKVGTLRFQVLPAKASS